MKRRIGTFSLIGLCILAVGCAPARLAAPAGEEVADPAQLAADLSAATTPAARQQITFDWSLDEGGSRVRGRGVVRVEAPRRIRLDLFGPRGETYLAAALVDNDYRFPTATPPPVELPSPALLWAALGVFRQPMGAELLGASADSTSAEIRYHGENDELFQFTFGDPHGNPPLLASVQRAAGRNVIETVRLDRSEDGSIAVARYRDWSAFRDLTLEVQEMREVASFPPEIWVPGV